MGRSRSTATSASRAPSERSNEPALRVHPLVCTSCGAAVPLGDGDVLPCPYCRAPVAVPAEHRALRAAQRARAADLAQAEALYRALGEPPGFVLRLWAGAVGGVFGVLARVVGGALRLWGRFILWILDAVKSVEDVRFLLFLAALPLIPLLLALLWFDGALHGLAPALGADPVDVLSLGGALAAAAGIAYAVFALPVVVFRYGEAFASVRRRIQASLAARPPLREGGPSLCRQCGAALEVPAGALGVRCAYCHCDNLVALPAAWVSGVRAEGHALHREVGEAAREEREVRSAARRRAWGGALASALVVPLFGGAGYGLVRAGLVTDRAGWSDAVRGPRGLLARAREAAASGNDPGGYDVALRRGDVLWLRLDLARGGRGGAEPPGAAVTGAGGAVRVPLQWAAQGDGGYAARFDAPFSGWFAVELSGAGGPGARLSAEVAPAGIAGR